MTSEVFSFRSACVEDIQQILDIEARVHPCPWNEQHLKAEIEKPYSRFLVMTDDATDSVIAAYIVFWILEDTAQILNVAVDMAHRRQGLAKKMLQKAIQLIAKTSVKKVILEVRTSNIAAIQLYQAHRFDTRQIHKRFYSNGEDAYQMVLEVESNQFDF